MPVDPAIQFMNAAMQQGYTGKFAFTTGAATADQLAKLSPDARARILGGDGFPPVSAAKQYPKMNQFVAEMAAAKKSGDKTAQPTTIGLRPWTAVHIIADLMNQQPKGSTIDAKAVTTALNGAQNIDTGFFKWTPTASAIALLPRISNPYVFQSSFDKKGVSKLLHKDPINAYQLVPNPLAP